MNKIRTSQTVYVNEGKIHLGLSQYLLDEEERLSETLSHYSVNLTAKEAVFLIARLESAVEELALGEKSRQVDDLRKALLVCRELGIN